jgi:hypothetical protein
LLLRDDVRSQSRDFLKRALSESGRAKAIFSSCRGNAQPASTQALRIESELSKEPIVAYRAIANIQSRPQLEPEQLPSTGSERQLIYTLNPLLWREGGEVRRVPAFALVGLAKILLPLALRHPLCVAGKHRPTCGRSKC